MKTTRNELKLRADKCPIKRFKAFIGKANTQATLCADTGIEIIGWSGFDASDLNAKSHRVELARFIAAADPETILALLAELEAKDKRIAELSRLLAHNIERAEKAEKRLATPVRLVDYRNSPDMHTKQYYEAIGFNQGIDACSVAVRTAGFTVEGDDA